MDLTLARHLTRRVQLRVADKDWQILFSHGVLLEVEAATGLDLMAKAADLLNPTAVQLREMAHALLAAAGCDQSKRRIASEVFSVKHIGHTRSVIENAWSASMPDPDEAEDAREDGDQHKKQIAVTWLGAWARAHQDLHIDFDQWLSITPRMAEALFLRRLEITREQEYMLSKIAAATANFGPRSLKDPIPEDAFMTHYWPGRDPSLPKTGEDVLAEVMPLVDDKSKTVMKGLT